MATNTNPASSANGAWLRAAIGVYLVVLVLAIHPFTAQPALDVKRLVTAWTALFVSAACFVAIARRRLTPNPPTALGGVLGAYLAYTGVSALLSAHSGYALTQWLTVAGYAALYLTASQCFRTVEQARRVFLTVAVGVALASVYGFCQYAGVDPFPWAERTSAEYLQMPSTFGNPNYAGHTLALALILVAGLGGAKGTRRYWILGAPLLAHFLMTRMRGGAVALAAGAVLVVVAVLARRSKMPPARTVLWAIAGAALAGVLCVVAALGVHRLSSGQFLPLDPSLLLRYNSYFGATRMILAHPVTGVGPGGYAIENPPFWTGFEQLWFATEGKVNEHVHNDLLEEAVNSGLPAAGLYLAFLVGGMCHALMMATTATDARRRALAYSLAAFFLAFLVDGLFGFNLRVPVSGALLFVAAGVLEGLRERSSQGPNRTLQPVIACAVVTALLGALTASGDFVAQNHAYYGSILAKSNERSRALTHFAAATDVAPWRWELWCGKGQSAHAVGQLDDAIRAFKQSAAQNPNYLPTLDALARTYADRAAGATTQRGAGDQDGGPSADLREAAACADRVLTLCPDLADTLECRGRIHSLQAVVVLRSGKKPEEARDYWKAARTDLEAAAKLGGQNRGRVQRMLAEACVALGDIDAAQNAFVQTLEVSPDAESLRAFFTLCLRSNRYRTYLNAVGAAIAQQEKKTSRNRGALTELYLALADAYHQIGGQRDAESEVLQKALLYSPDRYALWGRYAALHATLQPLREARDRIVRAGDTAGSVPRPIELLLTASPAKPQNLAEAVTLAGQACLSAATRSGTDALKQDFGWLANGLREQIEANAGTPEDKGKALRALGALYAALSQIPLADQVLSAAQNALDGMDRVYCTLEHANLLMQAGQHEEALATAELARKDAPNDALVLLCLARNYAALGRTDQARGLYETLRQAPRMDQAVRTQVEQELGALR